MEHSNDLSFEDALDVVGSVAYVWKGDRTGAPIRLTRGGDPSVGAVRWFLGLDLSSLESVFRCSAACAV